MTSVQNGACHHAEGAQGHPTHLCALQPHVSASTPPLRALHHTRNGQHARGPHSIHCDTPCTTLTCERNLSQIPRQQTTCSMQRTTDSTQQMQRRANLCRVAATHFLLRCSSTRSTLLTAVLEYSAPDTDSAGWRTDDLLSAIREVRVREEPRLAEVRALPFDFSRAQAPARAASHNTTNVNSLLSAPLLRCCTAAKRGAGHRVSIFVAISCAFVTWMPATT